MDYATILQSLNGYYKALNLYEEGRVFQQEAVDIQERLLNPNSSEYYSTLLAKAELEKNREKRIGYIQEAEKSFLKHFKQTQVLYQNIYSAYQHLYEKERNKEKTIEYQKKIVALNKALFGEEHIEYAESLSDLAKLYERTFDSPREAEPYHKQALELYLKLFGPKHPETVRRLAYMGRLYATLGQIEKAEDYFIQAYQANAEEENSALNPNNLGILWQLKTKDLNRSTSITGKYIQALRQQQVEGTKKTEDLEKAELLARYQYSLFKKQYQRFALDASKKNTLAYLHGITGLVLRLSQKLNKAQNEELFSLVEYSKASFLREAGQGQRARSLGGLPEELALEELALKEAFEELDTKLAKAPAKKRPKLQAKQSDLLIRIDSFKQELAKNYPKYHKLKYTEQAVRSEDIRNHLSEKSLMLSFFVSENGCYLFALNSENLQLYPLDINYKELTKKIRIFRKALSDYAFINEKPEQAYKQYTEQAYWFYEHLLKQALEQERSDIDKLYILTDAELGHIPFEAFLTEPATENMGYKNLAYLLRKYTISYQYSAQLFVEQQQKVLKAIPPSILAFAAEYKGEEEPENLLAHRTSYQQMLRKSLDPLPGAKRELDALAQKFSGSFYSLDLAQEARFKEQASDAGIIHLAMHGILNARNPALSSLAFSEDGSQEEDNFLEAWEISRLPLSAHLLVLSACETGYGRVQRGEGVISLGWAFFYAGAQSIIMSLWQVNDASTSLLMQLFYKRLFAAEPVAQALRNAKLDFIDHALDDLVAHPAYWAAFVQIGDDRPLQLESKAWIYYSIAVLFSSFILLFLWYRRRKK